MIPKKRRFEQKEKWEYFDEQLISKSIEGFLGFYDHLEKVVEKNKRISYADLGKALEKPLKIYQDDLFVNNFDSLTELRLAPEALIISKIFSVLAFASMIKCLSEEEIKEFNLEEAWMNMITSALSSIRAYKDKYL